METERAQAELESAVAGLRVEDRDVDGFVRTLRTRETDAGTELDVPVGDRVNVASDGVTSRVTR